MALTDPELDASVIAALRELPAPDGRGMVACVSDLFAADAPPLLEKMQQAAAVGDWAAVGAAAHALKSYAGNVGALQFMAQLRTLEMAAKAGDGATCRRLLGPLPAACAAVGAALAREAACP